jgi:phenylacetic acid degradation operon negative regulatory protein
MQYLLCDYVDLLATRGKSLTWTSSFPSPVAYRVALHRLRQAGLVARVDSKHKPIIKLTSKAYETLPDVFRPDRVWKKKWNGIWYIVLYDVPQTDAAYRQTLRTFLKRMRMGCFQKSVWITPKDIRPMYDDLVKAAGLRDYAILFEARTVLGQPSRELVYQAWDMDALREGQKWYCQVFGDNLERIRSAPITRTRLEQFAREEMSAYVTVMDRDPLLPGALLPPNYLGRDVYKLHRRILRAVTDAL